MYSNGSVGVGLRIREQENETSPIIEKTTQVFILRCSSLHYFFNLLCRMLSIFFHTEESNYNYDVNCEYPGQ